MTHGTLRHRLVLVGLLALGWLLGASAGRGAEPDLGPLLDAMGVLPPVKETEAPAFTLSDLAGTPRRLADFKGQVVLINFWATWCLPCREEMPAMERLYREMKNGGFTILAVNFAETPEQVEPFVKELRLTFPILLDQEGQVSRLYRAFSLPATYLIDR
ncbi:MAG TPA: TlpA disulfide reductase family protein, partial [Candidatus Methylomirabilis sp.]|nr:TlpA disulfide reductase family protein [Candidatus Methylomirabilis sp.]